MESIVHQNNLYMVSEAGDSSLVEELPRLIKKNKNNKLISVQLIYDLLKILHNIYSQD